MPTVHDGGAPLTQLPDTLKRVKRPISTFKSFAKRHTRATGRLASVLSVRLGWMTGVLGGLEADACTKHCLRDCTTNGAWRVCRV